MQHTRKPEAKLVTSATKLLQVFEKVRYMTFRKRPRLLRSQKQHLGNHAPNNQAGMRIKNSNPETVAMHPSYLYDAHRPAHLCTLCWHSGQGQLGCCWADCTLGSLVLGGSWVAISRG